MIIHVRRNLHAGIADGVEGQHRYVKVEQVGIVAVDGVEGAVVEIRHKLLRRLSRPVLPAPLAVDGPVVPSAVREVVVLPVELLRVKSLPPLLRSVSIRLVAVLLRQPSVILHSPLLALQVEAARRLIPCPRMVGMERDAEGQSGLSCCLGPSVEDVLVRAYVLSVPLLVFRVPEVKIVVMVAQCKEILGATFLLVEPHQFLGVPVLGLEERQDVLKAHFGGVAVVLTVIVVLYSSLHIHFTGHPVAAALHALWPPVGPDAELGIAKPLRHLVGTQRLPVGSELSRSHWLIVFQDGDFVVL